MPSAKNTGAVYISNSLKEKIKRWVKKNGNRYYCGTIRQFVEQACFEKLKDN